jgi:hypothetical protein
MLLQSVSIFLVGVGANLFFGWREMPNPWSWRPWCGLMVVGLGLVVAEYLGAREANKVKR